MNKYWYNKEKSYYALQEDTMIKRIDPLNDEVMEEYKPTIFNTKREAELFLLNKGYSLYRIIYGD